MAYLRPLANNFGYYPRAMIRLCVTAYEQRRQLAAKVGELGWRVAWGPVEHRDGSGQSHGLTYIAKRDRSDEYTVVIRGASPYLMGAWFTEEQSIATKCPFKRLAPHAPDDTHISQGTFDAISTLLETVDGITGQDIVGFLNNTPPTAYIYVTGHGTGGTLVPPLFACLNDLLYGGGYVANMAPFAFGGHTPGDAAFAIYFNSLFDQHFPWRMHNSLDIAPLCWHSLRQVRDIYKPHGLEWHPAEGEAIEAFFGNTSGKGYSHPSGSQLLQSSFDDFDEKTWFEQAIHQHHASTYQTLVDAAFPEQ